MQKFAHQQYMNFLYVDRYCCKQSCSGSGSIVLNNDKVTLFGLNCSQSWAVLSGPKTHFKFIQWFCASLYNRDAKQPTLWFWLIIIITLRKKASLKTSFQLRMELKKGQKQSRDERTQEDYPTSAKILFTTLFTTISIHIQKIHVLLMGKFLH